MVLDCTDRPYTRYLINDACVRLSLPLVSGAALGAAGQWAVYGGSYLDPTTNTPSRRACYRCLWPKPGPSARCDEAGVWGPVTGMVGSGMAAEALRILTDGKGKPLLHILHMGGSPMVRSVGMRPPSVKCIACGPEATIMDELADYDALCGTGAEVAEIPQDERLSATVSFLPLPELTAGTAQPRLQPRVGCRCGRHEAASRVWDLQPPQHYE